MQHAWQDRLSEYLDGELSPAEKAGLEAHLAECTDCRSVLADLEQVVRVARHAPVRAPEQDLWAGIAARIAQPQPSVVPIETRRLQRRQFTFTLPQLAAAAALVMLLGAGGLYMAMFGLDRQDQQTVAQAPRSQPSPAQLVSLNYDAHEDAIQELERALDQQRTRLDTTTVRVVAQSLATIDRAIADARAALDQDPSNPFLHRHLDGAMKKKIDILQRAVSVRRAVS